MGEPSKGISATWATSAHMLGDAEKRPAGEVASRCMSYAGLPRGRWLGLEGRL